MEGELEQNSQQTNSQENSPEQDDLSKKTIIVLVILTVIISILGTWTVLTEVKNVPVAKQPTVSSAEVKLNIISPPGTEAEQQKQISTATGRVALDIINPPNQ